MSSVHELFWKCVSQETENCILWARPAKYGRARGPIFEGGKSVNLARAACVLRHGAAPFEGAHAAHSCSNPSCINPRHVSWKTSSENQRDRAHHSSFQKAQISLDWVKPEYIERVTGALQLGVTPNAVAHSFGMPVTVVLEIGSRNAWRKARVENVVALFDRAGLGSQPLSADHSATGTLAEFLATRPRGEMVRMAKAIGTSKGYISSIASGGVAAGGAVANNIQKYAAHHGFVVTLDSLVNPPSPRWGRKSND